jgi:hypothetical protein
MPVEVSLASKSTPAEVTAQATKSTHEKPVSNIAGGVVEGPVTAKGSQQDQDVRNNPAESTTEVKLPYVSAASETQRRPASAIPSSNPLSNSISVDQVNKRTLGIAPKPKGVPNLNEEEKTMSFGRRRNGRAYPSVAAVRNLKRFAPPCRTVCTTSNICWRVLDGKVSGPSSCASRIFLGRQRIGTSISGSVRFLPLRSAPVGRLRSPLRKKSLSWSRS